MVPEKPPRTVGNLRVSSSIQDLDNVEFYALVLAAWEGVGTSFERFCVMAGIASLQRMLSEDAERLAGSRHDRASDRPGYRWGRTTGKAGFHGGTMAVERPRVRDKAMGRELSLRSWEEARNAGFLGQIPSLPYHLDRRAADRPPSDGEEDAELFGAAAQQSRQIKQMRRWWTHFRSSFRGAAVSPSSPSISAMCRGTLSGCVRIEYRFGA